MSESNVDRRLYWNDQSSSITSKQTPQRICVNASLPYHSKLNIRIHSHRRASNEDLNDIRTTARIERLEIIDDQQHEQNLKRMYRDHYSTLPLNGSVRGLTVYDQRFHQMSIPVSLPIDHRLHLYIRNGEVLARC